MPKKISNNLRLELGSLGQRRKPLQGPAEEAPEGALRILVVDDDPDMRSYVRRCLRRLGRPMGPVEEANDGLAAWELLRSGLFNLLICDLVMPGLDGAALIERVRAAPRLAHVRMLLMTGEAAAAETHSASATPNEVILKPFNARQLCERLAEILEDPR